MANWRWYINEFVDSALGECDKRGEQMRAIYENGGGKKKSCVSGSRVVLLIVAEKVFFFLLKEMIKLVNQLFVIQYTKITVQGS